MAERVGIVGSGIMGSGIAEVAAKHPPGKGDYTIPAGGTLTLRYRF